MPLKVAGKSISFDWRNMGYRDILDELKKKCIEVAKQCDESQKGKYLAILDILREEDCFKKLDAPIALNILIDLGYGKKEAEQRYIQILTSKD